MNDHGKRESDEPEPSDSDPLLRSDHLVTQTQDEISEIKLVEGDSDDDHAHVADVDDLEAASDPCCRICLESDNEPGETMVLFFFFLLYMLFCAMMTDVSMMFLNLKCMLYFALHT